jgi:hypothetical protein
MRIQSSSIHDLIDQLTDCPWVADELIERAKKCKLHLIFVSPMQAVNPIRQGTATREQFFLIRSDVPENLWPPPMLLYYTGLRTGKAKCRKLLLRDFRRSALANLIDAGTSKTDTALSRAHRLRIAFDRFEVRNTDRSQALIGKVAKSRNWVRRSVKVTRKSLKARSSVG